MYLMHDEDTGEREAERALRSLTRNMKQVAQRYDIPVVVSTQTLESKRKAGRVTANSIGYTSLFLTRFRYRIDFTTSGMRKTILPVL
jgi:hypothetical protein